MIFNNRDHGDGRLWGVLIIAGVILVVAWMRTYPQVSTPVADLIFQGDTLRLATGNEIGEARDQKYLGAAVTPFFFAPVPVNNASKSLLMTLPGIGEGLAGKIIEFRDQHGKITSIEQFSRINGIGAKRRQALQHAITFE